MKKSVLSMLAVAALVFNDFLQRSQENKRRS